MSQRIAVISHACVVETNQSPYIELSSHFEVSLIVPSRWRDTLRPDGYTASRSPAFAGRFVRVRTVGLGHPQRHVALVRARALLQRERVSFVVIEEEPFSLAAAKWSRAATRLALPFAVQVAENLPRHLPAPVSRECRRVLEQCAFVLARSPAALERAREWGYRGPATVVAHGVDNVSDGAVAHPLDVVGFVGRLVTEKGVDDLAAALDEHSTLRLRVAGDGPRREAFARLGDRVEMLGTLASSQMPAFYDSISVLAVPSRTTPTWSEQFGRVIVEAEARATPVVAYDSGEIPWVARETGAELVREGDVAALGACLERVAKDPDLARKRGESAREAVRRQFTNRAGADALARFIARALG